MNNVTVTFETIHLIQRENHQLDKISLKLYTSKAYDMIEWNCVVQTLKFKGFWDNFLSLIY